MEDKSFAMELLGDLKRANKRMFIIWICTFFGLLISVGYIVYLLNDISVIETTEQIIEDVETIENSNISNGE